MYKKKGHGRTYAYINSKSAHIVRAKEKKNEQKICKD